MKTKTQTKTRKQARKNKAAVKNSKVIEAIKTGVFFAVPIVVILVIFVFNGVKSFNAF